MKIPLNFLVHRFLPPLLNAKAKRKALYLPLVHINNANYFDYKILTPLLLSPCAYKGVVLAEIFIGSPCVRQYLHIDTRITLTWNQCYPCFHCFDHTYPKWCRVWNNMVESKIWLFLFNWNMSLQTTTYRQRNHHRAIAMQCYNLDYDRKAKKDYFQNRNCNM